MRKRSTRWCKCRWRRWLRILSIFKEWDVNSISTPQSSMANNLNGCIKSILSEAKDRSNKWSLKRISWTITWAIRVHKNCLSPSRLKPFASTTRPSLPVSSKKKRSPAQKKMIGLPKRKLSYFNKSLIDCPNKKTTNKNSKTTKKIREPSILTSFSTPLPTRKWRGRELLLSKKSWRKTILSLQSLSFWSRKKRTSFTSRSNNSPKLTKMLNNNLPNRQTS